MTDTTRNDLDDRRATVVDRYSSLARRAIAGQTPNDVCGADGQDQDCFGAAQYAAAAPVPEAARRASLGCGNPLAVAGITAGEVVLDLGSGGGLDVILSA